MLSQGQGFRIMVDINEYDIAERQPGERDAIRIVRMTSVATIGMEGKSIFENALQDVAPAQGGKNAGKTRPAPTGAKKDSVRGSCDPATVKQFCMGSAASLSD